MKEVEECKVEKEREIKKGKNEGKNILPLNN